MSSLVNKSALIFGEDTRSFLTVIRSLAKQGMQIDVVCFSNTSPALKSKYINCVYGLNHQAMSIEQWTSAVKELLTANNYDVVIPCDERSLFPLLDISEALNLNTKFALPKRDILGPLFDKTQTRFLAEQCSIPVANGEKITLSNFSYQELIQKFSLPLVLKPTESYDEEHLNQRQSVKIVRNKEDYDDFLQHSSHDCLAESYFTGYGVGVSVLADKGSVIGAFSHARVAEPESGGGSSYRKAIPIDPSMLYACQKFCMKLSYTGVAMFEFKYNPNTEEWILIEINARFWGSLPLAVNAGVDFPAMYAAILLDIPLEDKLTYNLNAFSRSLTADIYDIKKEFDHKANTSKAGASVQLFKRLVSFGRIFSGNEYVDSFSWHDRAPFWRECVDLFKDKIEKLPIIKNRLQQKRLTTWREELERPVTHILFICYGNIMRSPFAGELFKLKVKGTPLAKLATDSFGFHQVTGRSAKPQCIEMAQQWGVDLAHHQSKCLNYNDCLEPGTIVIIMDKKNEHILQSYYPKVRYISLADLIPEHYGFYNEIADPYDRPPEYLKTCYEHINASIEQLVLTLNQSNRNYAN